MTRELTPVLVFALTASACAATNYHDDAGQADAAAEKTLYVWAADRDSKEGDFLATIDADPASAQYGRIIATTPVGVKGTVPHHTEYEYPREGLLLANGFNGNRTFAFDMRDARAPNLAEDFTDVGDYSYLHSVVRLPGGRIVGTFQGKGGAYGAPGGIVEMTERGEVVRAVSAVAPGVQSSLAWPYSITFAPVENRLIVTMSEMGMPGQTSYADTKSVQIYNAQSLALTAVVELPATAGGRELWPAEPRVASDGTVFVNTFMCGLYRIDDVGGAVPHAEHVYSFPIERWEDACAVPVIVGDYLVQTVGSINGLIALDISDPNDAVEASRLVLDHAYHMPHWLAADEDGRLVVTGMADSWVLMAKIDKATGALSLDQNFRDAGADRPGVFVGAAPLPHGDSGPTLVHGALFRR
jgi:hypothetical protein